jgi:hypothetical protein
MLPIICRVCLSLTRRIFPSTFPTRHAAKGNRLQLVVRKHCEFHGFRIGTTWRKQEAIVREQMPPMR